MKVHGKVLLAVGVEMECEALVARAREVARRLDVPLAAECSDAELLLAVTVERLELRQPGDRVRPVFVDFASPDFTRRVRSSGKRSLIARAIGFKGTPLRVLDTTAGFGRDAMLMAAMGCDVIALERDALVHLLLEDGLRRAEQVGGWLSDAARRVSLHHAESREYLARDEQKVDVVYVDPMFPSTGRSALPKRDLQLLARMVGTGSGEASQSLLAAAIRTGAGRVVIKRADDGPVLFGPDGERPVHQFRGRTVRFDVYLPRRG